MAGKGPALTTSPKPAASAPATFTGAPTIVTRAMVASLRLQKAIGNRFGGHLDNPSLAAFPTTVPPRLATLGLSVVESDIDGWQVWTLRTAAPSAKYILCLHGGAFTLQPSLFHWIDYASIARKTAATVVVPLYPLVPQGTAGTVVPQTADLISSLIKHYGPDAVSVYGDSAGANIGLAAAQELVRRKDAMFARMVLVSPVVDLSLTNPSIALIDDPVIGTVSSIRDSVLWAGDLELTDPLASPLYGSLAGLPPTWVYAGSLELLAPDVLRLRDKAVAEGADITFILRKGEIHDWAGPGSLIPFTAGAATRPQIRRQLVGAIA
jgi:triacylglycerol lipase